MLTTHTAGRIPPSLFRNICIGTVLNSQVQGHCVSGTVNLDQLLQILEGKKLSRVVVMMCVSSQVQGHCVSGAVILHTLLLFSPPKSPKENFISTSLPP
jgi:hypothetical protein